MKFLNLVLLATSLAAADAFRPFSNALKAPYCPPRAVDPWQQKAIFEEFIGKFYGERNATKALLDHMPEDYIQHNPFVLSGRDTAIQGLSFFSPETVNFTVARHGVDGGIAFAHVRMQIVGSSDPSAVVDLFRFNGSCMQEHWDVIQQEPKNATNPLAMW